jgi:MoaA/NifB/PqqE/SkfB family radical SAM enzyme
MNKKMLLDKIKETLEFKPSSLNINMNGADFITRFILEYGILEYVKIRILTKCNCNCDMCTWILENKKKEIPKEKILELYKQFNILGVKHINFTGGEPTLRKDLIELIKEGKRAGFKISISTNGNFSISLGKKIIDAGVDMIDFSLDSSTSSFHDKIRGMGVWKKAIQNMKMISHNSNVITLMNFTIRKDNYKESEKMIELAKKLSVRKVSFSMVYTEDNPKKEVKELELEKNELNDFYLNIVPRILRKAMIDNIEVKFSPYFKELENLPYSSQALKILLNPKKFAKILKERLIEKKPSIREYVCKEIQKKSRIDNLGNVSLCCTLDEDAKKMSIGNILKDNFVNIWLNENYVNARNSISPSNKCFFCKIDSNNF